MLTNALTRVSCDSLRRTVCAHTLLDLYFTSILVQGAGVVLVLDPSLMLPCLGFGVDLIVLLLLEMVMYCKKIATDLCQSKYLQVLHLLAEGILDSLPVVL